MAFSIRLFYRKSSQYNNSDCILKRLIFIRMHSRCVEDGRTNGRLEAQVSEDGLAVDQFLCDESSSGKHCQTAILELLRADDAEFFRVGGLEAQRIEA